MVNFGWDYPPGVSSIPGDFDVVISFTVSFLYESELDIDEKVEVIPCIIRDTLGINDLEFDDTTFKIDESNKFSIVVSYSDDIDCDGKYLDYEDVDEIIIDHMNKLSPSIELDYQDPSIEIDYRVHK